jgi:hypothetical protein
MRLVKNLILVLTLSLGISCGGDDNDDVIAPVVNPTAVTLNFPLNNTECNEGTIISESRSEVIFKWTGATNNDSYTVSLKNLETGVIKNYNTNFEELPISILRGVPYAWSVISKVAGNSETAESAIWKFYNAGLPKESHPPFPAEVVSPLMGSTVVSGEVKLQWKGSDVDNDINSYTVLFDTSETPTIVIGNPTTSSINVEVESGNVYYWKVISIDADGNSSDSELFQFKAK